MYCVGDFFFFFIQAVREDPTVGYLDSDSIDQKAIDYRDSQTSSDARNPEHHVDDTLMQLGVACGKWLDEATVIGSRRVGDRASSG